VYDIGWMRANWLVSAVINWGGDWAFVRRINYKVPMPNILGDTTWCHGKVKRKFVEASEHLVDIVLWGENQRGERNCEGSIVLRLPSRDPADQYTFDGQGHVPAQ
jgi:hypothetical protein